MNSKSCRSRVEYGQPPTEHRFAKGVSGNPAGRPKKKPALSEAIDRELGCTITLMESGKREALTKAQVIAKQLTNGALKGDFKSLKLLTEMLSKKDRTEALLEISSPLGASVPELTPEEVEARLEYLLKKGGFVQISDSVPLDPEEEIPLEKKEG